VHKAVVIAHGVHESGRKEILGIDVGLAETEAFWTEFLRSLVKRGLVGVQLVISDAHEGPKTAIARVLACPWQRCTVHFLRDMLGHARKDQHGALCAVIRPIFSADSDDQARARLADAVDRLRPALPKVAELLAAAEEELLTSTRSRPRTGQSCAVPTRSSGSTARSAGAPTSSASSPTTAA
jgi:putative transposase